MNQNMSVCQNIKIGGKGLDVGNVMGYRDSKRRRKKRDKKGRNVSNVDQTSPIDGETFFSQDAF